MRAKATVVATWQMMARMTKNGVEGLSAVHTDLQASAWRQPSSGWKGDAERHQERAGPWDLGSAGKFCLAVRCRIYWETIMDIPGVTESWP